MTFNEAKFRQSLSDGDMQTTIQQLQMLQAVGGTLQFDSPEDLQVNLKQTFEVELTRIQEIRQKATVTITANNQEEAWALVEDMKIPRGSWKNAEHTGDYDQNICVEKVTWVPLGSSKPSNILQPSGQGRVN